MLTTWILVGWFGYIGGIPVSYPTPIAEFRNQLQCEKAAYQFKQATKYANAICIEKN